MKRLIDTDALLKAVANANIESPEDAMEIIDHAPDATIVGLETLNAMVQAAALQKNPDYAIYVLFR